MDCIRNVCILAHVDHGKTSLADVLISSSGIISKRQAGDVRFMDSTFDEQQRGITMKSSSVSFVHEYCNKLKEKYSKNYLINLIDSPGHVDFSGEVSTAVKLSDSAFIVVDVVEGVCPQTRTVIQQAWREKLVFILVLNKIDKLINELKLSTMDAYVRLFDIIEAVHHLIGELISCEVKEIEEQTGTILTADYIESKYDTNPFHPLKGKVTFCSAFHHWGFRIQDFIDVYSNILSIDKQDLYRKMWGDYYLNSKKCIVKGAKANHRKNLFTSLILDQIWNVYTAFSVNDYDKICKMMEKLQISVDIRRNVSSKDHSAQTTNIRQVFNSWMPLATSLLDALVEKCPDPKSAIESERKLNLLVPNKSFLRAREILRNAEIGRESPVVLFVTKIMLILQEERTFNKDLIALGRVYSGHVMKEQKMFIFSPRFNPYKVSERFFSMKPDDFDEGPINICEEAFSVDDCRRHVNDVSVFRIKELYRFIGQERIALKNGAQAGHIVGITGLDWTLSYKTAVIAGNCCLGDCFGLFFNGETICDDVCNIICVSVEPKVVSLRSELEEALRILEKSDPIVNISVSHIGELLLYTAGEIHLQKCLNELTMNIAPHIELEVSPPIVPFRETVIHRSKCNMDIYELIKKNSKEFSENSAYTLKVEIDLEKRQFHQGIEQSIVVYIRLPQKTGTCLCCQISAHSLPQCVVDWIEKNYAIVFRLMTVIKRKGELSKSELDTKSHLLASLKSVFKAAYDEEKELCETTDTVPIDYQQLFDYLWSIGKSTTTQSNALFGYMSTGMFLAGDDGSIDSLANNAIFIAITKGFQNALKAGPFCQEPMKNVSFIIHNIWEMHEKKDDSPADNRYDVIPDDNKDNSKKIINFSTNQSLSCLSCNPGQICSLVTKACQLALFSHPGARLMIAMYKLDIEIRVNFFKNLSSLICQLHGEIVQQELNVGNFVVEARIPVIESFGFGDKLRKKTSGEVGLPQLKTILWEVLDCSPLFDTKIFAIADASEDCEINISTEVVQRTQGYLNSIRLRKGLLIRQQLVEDGDKQRTLSRNK